MGTTSEQAESPNKKLLFGLAFFIILLGVFFRFHWITDFPLGLYPDEAMNGSNALEALETGNFKIFYPENNGREGFFINIQALSVWYFGNTPWALRAVSAVFGSLTVFGILLLSYEVVRIMRPGGGTRVNGFASPLFFIRRKEIIPILASFFAATSFWHINFSRIGFRAILVPFLSAFGIYFLLKGLRRGRILDFVWAGIFIGLGFHTYIAFRMIPLVIALPILWYGWNWIKNRYQISDIRYHAEESAHDTLYKIPNTAYCVPCAAALFLLVTFVAALPIGYYFLKHPEDLLGRTGQVSVFTADSPALEFLKSNAQTIGMFFVRGDCNWRHNFACKPELNQIAGFFFAVGVISSLYELWKSRLRSFPHLLLLWWAAVMTLPATLTREGLPHALRAIGMIPPVFALAGYGGYVFASLVLGALEKGYNTLPEMRLRILRIAREFSLLFLIVPLFIPFMTYEQYFFRWASRPDTYSAFAADLYHLGQFLDKTPDDTKKYVIVNMSGTDVRGIPMPAQTVIFTTGTFTKTKRAERNIAYLLPEALDSIPNDGDRVLIAPLNGNDTALRNRIKEKFPDFRESAPGDFIIYKNY